jgi:CheY-like chemotaxis protein
LEGRLGRAEQLSALGRFVAGAVHELNNPLTVVQGYAELLQEQPLPAAVVQRLQAIQGQARHASAIVSSLVRLSQSAPREQESEKPATQKSCDLAEVIHETVAACARDLAERGVLVHVQADPSLFVAAEPSEVTLMLTDMLKKASDAIPPSGRREIFVAARRSEEIAELSVADTRDSASLNRTTNRTTVTLAALPDAQHPAHPGGSALVVVEEELARALWQETLINQHWTTASVATPAEALRHLGREHFDVVLIDSSSPLQDGLPLRAEMDCRGWHTPLILVTGDQVDPASRQAIAESGCPWLSKPFRIGELRQVLESTLLPA